MSPKKPRPQHPSLARVLNETLSRYSLVTGVVLALSLGIGTGVLSFWIKSQHQRSVLYALQNDVTTLAQSTDYREMERVLASFNEAMPDASFLYVRDQLVQVSIPDMQLSQTAYHTPRLFSLLGVVLDSNGELYSSIPLQDNFSHATFGKLILKVPARSTLWSALASTLLSFCVVLGILFFWRRITRSVLKETLLPLETLYADLQNVGQGKAPKTRAEDFNVRELADMSALVQKQYQDVRRLTEVTAEAAGERRAKDAVRSLLHDILNPYTALSYLVQAHILYPDDKEIQQELSSDWPTLDEQIRALLKTARHLEIEKLNARLLDLRATVQNGAQMGAVKNRDSVRNAFESSDTAPIQVRHDPELIARAVANLVRNSVEEGASAVEVWCEESPVSIHIRDNGPGIPADQVAPLFEGRLKSSKPDGSGIGFPTALRLVKMHGGNILLEKEDRPGVHFRIDLSALEHAL